MNFKNILLLPFIFLVGCELDYKDLAQTSSTPTITSQELVDPNAAANHRFGFKSIILANGNIVVVSPYDDIGASDAGAMHLYNPYTETLIKSIYGDNVNDQLGVTGVTALANNNFVIASRYDDVGGVSNAGSVMLINGTTGAQIGSTLAGDNVNDQLGASSVTALANNNFVIASNYDDVGGVTNAGSVRLINGTTGAQIGSTAGDTAEDHFGYGHVTALTNNNFVFAAEHDDVGGLSNAGSVRLINGTTGAQVGSTVVGNRANDWLGNSSVTALANNNFVIASYLDDLGSSVVDAGSVMLINGTTGAQIGSTLAGNAATDYLGASSVTALANNNFVIASRYDNVGSYADAGSVMLINGTTGAQVGSTVVGNRANDNLGISGITALTNNNFVIASAYDDLGSSVVDAGSVILINGTTGAQVGSTLAGNTATDMLGSYGVTALANNNFVIASYADNVGGVSDAGSVMLINGTTGAQIGSTLAGDNASDQLGDSGVTALANNNFVVRSRFDNVGGVTNAGSVKLINGATGDLIATVQGDTAEDQLGRDSVTVLANNNFVIASILDDEGGVSDAGSIRQIDTIGTQVSLKVGAVTNDMADHSVITTSVANFYIISLASYNKDTLTDSGSVSLVAF